MKSVTQDNQIYPPCVWTVNAYIPSEAFWNTQTCTCLKYKAFLQNASHSFTQGKKDKTSFLQCLIVLIEKPKPTFSAASFLPMLTSTWVYPPSTLRSLFPLSTEELHSNAVPLKLWVSSEAGRTVAQHAVETYLFGFHFQRPIKTGPACQARLASSEQSHP